VTVGSLRWDSIKCWNQEFEQIEKYSLREGDVVIGMDGSKVGKNRARIKSSDLPLLIAQRVACLRSNELSNQDFLYYLIRSDRFEMYVAITQTGSSVPHISQKQIEEFKIPWIPVKTQEKISSFLLNLDAKIELNTRINRELEQMAKLLYDYWFVQFDFPDANGKPYKSSGGKMVYNKELKREIPEGWEVDKIGNVLKTALGGTPSTEIQKYWEGGDFPWLNSGEIANFPITNSELKITKEAIKNSATELMPKGTVALSITRHLRPTIFAIDACANQSVVGIYENDLLKSSFIYPFIKNEIPRFLILRTGAQQPHINKQTIDETKLIVPNQKVLEKYYKLLNPIYNKIINNAFQNQRLTTLRDWLLPMLMNGQVRVGEAVKKEYLLNEGEMSVAAEPGN